MKISVFENPTELQMQFFEKKIEEFNLERWEEKKKHPIVIEITDEKGTITGGASGKTFGHWLLIENLWVSSELRGQDWGSKILKRLEQVAIDRGCLYALLDTLNFQARPFYEKYGYSVQWTQQEYPKSGCKYFMTKTLKN